MEDNNTTTIIPEPPELWPLELVIMDQLEKEAEQRESDMFERLEIERVYR